MAEPFTPEQEERIRAIVREEVAAAFVLPGKDSHGRKRPGGIAAAEVARVVREFGENAALRDWYAGKAFDGISDA